MYIFVYNDIMYIYIYIQFYVLHHAPVRIVGLYM